MHSGLLKQVSVSNAHTSPWAHALLMHVPQSPPAGGDCGTCINSACAQGDVCAFETDTCFNNPECIALNDCYVGCP